MRTRQSQSYLRASYICGASNEEERLEPVAVLTGATGFLRRHILSALLKDPSTARVHCIAVRVAARIQLDDARVQVHFGNLNAPRLGLGAAEAQVIFSTADTVIHNGADVSFLKTYSSLRRSNVTSTKQPVNLIISFGRGTSFHYISTAGIAQLATGEAASDIAKDGFAEASASTWTPPADGVRGYESSKWASERFLERVVQQQQEQQEQLRVVIHRPSSITGLSEDDGPPETDVVNSLLKYARKLGAVPAGLESIWRGYINLVSVDAVAKNIVAHPTVVNGPAVQYVHQSGHEEIPVENLKEWLQGELGHVIETLPPAEWVAKARLQGLDDMVALYLQSQSASQNTSMRYSPRILKDV
ncbi:hypothetical protein PWT90_00505 [Aphanocladium album]|nr:hypothetical protein PWT90_00505 [Aphanocladium album]